MAEEQTTDASSVNKAPLGHAVGGIGGWEPVIMINGYIFKGDLIVSMEVDSNGWLPECHLRLKSNDNLFLGTKFPKDGDLVNVYIRSFNDAFKPIRNDYIITEINTTKSKDQEAKYLTFFISGILWVPNLYTETCKAIKQKTSFEALTDICTDLKLGYVSNETKTDDKMTWINPWNTNEYFIRHIVKHSYKNLDSFFDSWIDYYYNLNFMNINKMLSVDDKDIPKDGIYKTNFDSDYNQTLTIDPIKIKNILTNNGQSKATQFYFDSIEVIYNSGKVSLMNGYRRNIFFYDKIQKKLVSFKVDPMITEGSNLNKIVQKGRPGENFYKTHEKAKWLGWQYATPDHNVHNHYKEAEIHNYQNMIELDKINIKIHLPNVNFNLYRGQKLPLIFTITDTAVADTSGGIVDKFLSGNYTIMGINLNYDGKKGFHQDVYLTRREWPVPNTTMGELGK